MKLLLVLSILLISATNLLCSSIDVTPTDVKPVQQPVVENGRISVLFYNAHNLFDAERDEGTGDWSYLPKDYPGKKEACDAMTNPYYKKKCHESDWTETKVKWKLERIKEAIQLVSPKLPDVLGLCEVENEKVVKMLADTLGYDKFIVTKGLDKRGIDNALLVKESKNLQLLRHLNDVEITDPELNKPTRNILRAQLLVGNRHKFDVYVNHWPSQGNPSKDRVITAKTLMNSIRKEGKNNVPSLLMGDFNTIDSDFPHPFKTVLYQGENAFTDVYYLLKKDKTVEKDLKNSFPLGTYFYIPKMQWNLLDLFFVNKELIKESGLRVDHKSFRILTHKKIMRDFTYSDERDRLKPHFQSVVKGIPWGYQHDANEKEKAGYSDHFPVKVDLIW